MTDNFKIELFDNSQDPIYLSKKLSAAFPLCSAKFFLRAINNLSYANSCLCILRSNNEIVGSVFLYKVCGYPDDVWNPSYLFVDKKARGLSLFFLVNSLRKRSRLSLDITPTNKVKILLKSLKFNPINNGSVFIPLLVQTLLPSKSRQSSRVYLEKTSSPFERFRGRSDLIWYRYAIDGDNGSICIKKASKWGFPLLILVYFKKDHLNAFLPSLIHELSGVINALSVLVVPNIGSSCPRYAIKIRKLHSFANFSIESIYSILGSEVTEII